MESTSFEEARVALVELKPVLRRLAARADQVDPAELGRLFADLEELKSALGALRVGVLQEARVQGEAWAGAPASPGSGRSFFK